MSEEMCTPEYCPECYYWNRENERCALVGGVNDRKEQVTPFALLEAVIKKAEGK